MNSKQKFMSFIDESGVANLNDTATNFFLSSVIIDKKDFEIIEGYLRLVKRKFLKDDFKTLHATDLFERPSSCYPELANLREVNSFIQELGHVINSIPFDCRLYYVNKDTLRNKSGYAPARGKKPSDINIELPYELCAKMAINQFTEYLIEKDAKGEIIIESRLFNDTQFVKTFDDARKSADVGGIAQPLYADVKNRITSLVIANKNQQDGGLELADLCAYMAYRYKVKDPKNKLSVGMDRINHLFGALKNHAYRGVNDADKRFIYEITP